MARVRGKHIRLGEMQIRRSPRLKRALPPEKKTSRSNKKAKRGRPSKWSRLNQESNTAATEAQSPEGTTTTTEKSPDQDTQRPRKEANETKEAPKEEKPTTEQKYLPPFQHPKYEGCIWIKGSLVPPYSGVRRWTSLEDAEIEPLLDRFEARIAQWVEEWAEDGEAVGERLSDEEKRLIMKGLGGYCVFKDWDELVEGLSKKDVEELGLVSPSISEDADGKEEEMELVEVQPNPPLTMSLNDAVESTSDVKTDVKIESIPDEPKESAQDEPEPMGDSTKDTPEVHPYTLSGTPDASPELAPEVNSDPLSTPNTPPSSSPEAPTSQPLLSTSQKKLPCPPGLPKLLVECLISQSLYKTIIQDPFYYLTKADDNIIDAVPTTFGRDFYNVWQRLMRASRVKAHRVRMELTQLLNGFDIWDQCHDISIGAQSRTLRKHAVQRLVDSLLADPSSNTRKSPIHPLLRPLDSQAQSTRTKHLVPIFREAAEIAVWMYTQESYFVFADEVGALGPFDGQITGREECLELGYKEVEDSMKPHGWTRGEYPDGVLNGRLPVLMVRPVLRRVFVDSWTSCALNERVGKVVSRAVVCLGNQEPRDADRSKW
ncbi:hypothetical protein P170DRAFT_475458 [Aspergillus steynii IBT 23096]|uniref:Uncharacterized protein n=1 Tax=Aspergillus steynii IBT 23096 TaxID=1392250 RepID=A0A2I2G8D7_9EURO|nr:uncharacterized protein P170DRAFT_475458 [Aspergillus steynii IBT 23096]PLB49141.1 hypothetical protein P170DRAFT_475458 [Aspergillus steynii IBT 23096]